MNIDDLVRCVEQGLPQPPEELKTFVQQVASGEVSREDATRWLKAVHAHGCHREDKIVLTHEMVASGAQLVWKEGPPVVDKHSTGGVGDKMSLMLAPALAACGCRVPMLAGRGLGHTGGTIDKLEAIPGFNCSLRPEEMVQAVESVGCCIAVQNDAIAPADGVLYALRDVTATIDSVPLITASIVSKKAAEGLDALVLDVKTGSAAFMQTQEQAHELAHSMVETASGLGIQTVAQLTTMDEPIGTHIGNALEIIESIEVLHGEGSSDTRRLVVMQGGALLAMTHPEMDEQQGRLRIEQVLDNGEALTKFIEMCIQQGVEPDVANRLVSSPVEVMGRSANQTTVLSTTTGFVQSVNAMKMANIARAHGAGRYDIDDIVDPLVGFVLHVAKGDPVEPNQPVLTFHHQRPLSGEEHASLQSLVGYSASSISPTSRLLEQIESPSTKP